MFYYQHLLLMQSGMLETNRLYEILWASYGLGVLQSVHYFRDEPESF